MDKLTIYNTAQYARPLLSKGKGPEQWLVSIVNCYAQHIHQRGFEAGSTPIKILNFLKEAKRRYQTEKLDLVWLCNNYFLICVKRSDGGLPAPELLANVEKPPTA